MNNPNERTFLDMKMWNKHIGQTYYEIHPTDKNQYRTYYIKWNAFVGAIRSYPSNYITGTPPDGMQPIHPLLLSQLNKMPQQATF